PERLESTLCHVGTEDPVPGPPGARRPSCFPVEPNRPVHPTGRRPAVALCALSARERRRALCAGQATCPEMPNDRKRARATSALTALDAPTHRTVPRGSGGGFTPHALRCPDPWLSV